MSPSLPSLLLLVTLFSLFLYWLVNDTLKQGRAALRELRKENEK